MQMSVLTTEPLARNHLICLRKKMLTQMIKSATMNWKGLSQERVLILCWMTQNVVFVEYVVRLNLTWKDTLKRILIGLIGAQYVIDFLIVSKTKTSMLKRNIVNCMFVIHAGKHTREAVRYVSTSHLSMTLETNKSWHVPFKAAGKCFTGKQYTRIT